MQNLDEIINDPEMYAELENAYRMTISYRSGVQFRIAEFRNCVFVSNVNRSFVIDYSIDNPYIMLEV